MQAQYDWIKEQLAQGKTVLAYDRGVTKARVYRLKSMDHVRMWSDNVMSVYNKLAIGWTFAVKPDPHK